MNTAIARKGIISSVRRVVLKLGSSVVTTDYGLDFEIIDGIVDDNIGDGKTATIQIIIADNFADHTHRVVNFDDMVQVDITV